MSEIEFKATVCKLIERLSPYGHLQSGEVSVFVKQIENYQHSTQQITSHAFKMQIAGQDLPISAAKREPLLKKYDSELRQLLQ